MFSYEEIQTYNETDICIYKYIVSNMDKVPYMTVRELAGEVHTSTSTILRFCGKNNFDGYAEFKEALKEEAARQHTRPPREDLRELSAFFARAASSAFEEKLDFAVEAVRKADLVIFIGMGKYGGYCSFGERGNGWAAGGGRTVQTETLPDIKYHQLAAVNFGKAVRLEFLLQSGSGSYQRRVQRNNAGSGYFYHRGAGKENIDHRESVWPGRKETACYLLCDRLFFSMVIDRSKQGIQNIRRWNCE